MPDDNMPDERGTYVARNALVIAQTLCAAPVKDRAETRRMGPEGSAFFWRMAARLDIPATDEAKWLVVTRLCALLTPSSATSSFHDPSRPFGAVLADGGDARARLDQPAVSEARLARLLAARGDARLTALERAVRAIARDARAMDAPSLAWAVINPDGQQIARAYYRRLDGGPVTLKTSIPETE